MKNINPFIPDKKHNPKYFCNRDNEISILIKEITENRNIFILANKGIGKTKLINHLFYILSQSGTYLTIYHNVDFPGTFDDFAGGLLNKIIDSLPKKKAKNFTRYSIDQNPGKGSDENLTDIGTEEILNKSFSLLRQIEKKIIIALDNCELFPHLSPEKIERMVIEPLSSIENITIILSGRKTILLPQNCKQIYLHKIDQSVYAKFIKDLFSKKGSPLSKKAISKLMIWSSGSTEIVQLVCSRLWLLNKKKIKLKDLESTLDQIIAEANTYYFHILNLISPYQLKLLRAIALQDLPFQVTSASFIKKYGLNAPSSVKTALKALSEKDLIFRKGNSYLLKDVLLNNWFNHRNGGI